MKRKPGLGHYNATKQEWLEAYRYARTLKRKGLRVDASKTGVEWKAQLIVFNDRESFDWYSVNTAKRLLMKKATEELLEELSPRELSC